MKRKYIETIVNDDYIWEIYEIGESVFWEGRNLNDDRSFRFHSLNALKDFINQADMSTNSRNLYQYYLKSNQSVKQ